MCSRVPKKKKTFQRKNFDLKRKLFDYECIFKRQSVVKMMKVWYRVVVLHFSKELRLVVFNFCIFRNIFHTNFIVNTIKINTEWLYGRHRSRGFLLKKMYLNNSEVVWYTKLNLPA